ncbi:ATP-binding protein [Pseudoflavonifractor phocaeensis]|uniref:ATP-binding protein n=1 Tax=Pseudoflavonifractor phocaeensis TaxID=1870988 RepID=UPI001958B327|nr:ATP-binding protein [Pseudoflavonifractor phocaeensis]MBM6927227.1 ATP-binding protein [Pseudoflavonifractor phocaeensis]
MLKSGRELRRRDLYLNRLIAFQDTEPVKIITGIRRCGKSSLMKLMVLHLRQNGVTDDQIIEMNFESMDFRRMTTEELYRYVKERLPEKKRAYLFFDEIQRIDQWQDAVNSFRVDFDCDIYVTGSNAYLLSSEYATYLAGRSVEIKVLPLSFREFLDFHGYVVRESKHPAGGVRKRIYDTDGESYEPQELLDAYLRFGGMPGIADVGLDTDKALTLLDGIYSTVVVRDILERERRRGQRQITDPDLLRKIIMFLADNIGNSTSITSISNTLVNEKLLDQSRRGNPSVHTIQAYVGALLESYIFYEIKRFDIKGKEYLRTLGKYYIVDIGLRNYLLGFRDMDTGHILENIVYFELLRRGYDVSIGKVDNKEVDFIAANAEEKRYIQVTESMNDPTTRQRELTPLRMIRDNYEKIVIAGNCDHLITEDGIKIIRLTDFLLDS